MIIAFLFATLVDALRPLYFAMTQQFFRDMQDYSRFVMECCSKTIVLSDDISRGLKVHPITGHDEGSVGE